MVLFESALTFVMSLLLPMFSPNFLLGCLCCKKRKKKPKPQDAFPDQQYLQQQMTAPPSPSNNPTSPSPPPLPSPSPSPPYQQWPAQQNFIPPPPTTTPSPPPNSKSEKKDNRKSSRKSGRKHHRKSSRKPSERKHSRKSSENIPSSSQKSSRRTSESSTTRKGSDRRTSRSRKPSNQSPEPLPYPVKPGSLPYPVSDHSAFPKPSHRRSTTSKRSPSPQYQMPQPSCLPPAISVTDSDKTQKSSSRGSMTNHSRLAEYQKDLGKAHGETSVSSTRRPQPPEYIQGPFSNYKQFRKPRGSHSSSTKRSDTEAERRKSRTQSTQRHGHKVKFLSKRHDRRVKIPRDQTKPHEMHKENMTKNPERRNHVHRTIHRMGGWLLDREATERKTKEARAKGLKKPPPVYYYIHPDPDGDASEGTSVGSYTAG